MGLDGLGLREKGGGAGGQQGKWTALDIARQEGHTLVVKVLERAATTRTAARP